MLTATAALAVGLGLVNAEKNRTAAEERKTNAALVLVMEEQKKTQLALQAETVRKGTGARAAERAKSAALAMVTDEQKKTQKALDAEKAAPGAARRRRRKAATEQRGLALQTMKDVVNKIDARLKDRPDLQKLRKELLNQAKEGLSRVARAADTAGQIDQETVWVLFELGDILLDLDGATNGAKEQYELANRLARKLADADPASATAQHGLSVSYYKIGDVQRAQGDLKGALAAFQDGLKISRNLADADPASATAQRDLSISYGRIGNVLQEQGDLKGLWRPSRTDSRSAANSPTPIPPAPPPNATCPSPTRKLAMCCRSRGTSRGALAAFADGLTIRRKLADADPSSATAQRNLSSVSYLNISARAASAGRPQGGTGGLPGRSEDQSQARRRRSLQRHRPTRSVRSPTTRLATCCERAG